MSLRIDDLKPGERVRMFCPSARREPRREAIFEGVLAHSAVLAMVNSGVTLMPEREKERIRRTEPKTRYAIFLMQTAENTRVDYVERDGSFTRMDLRGGGRIELRQMLEIAENGARLKDDENRAIYIEERVAMGAG